MEMRHDTLACAPEADARAWFAEVSQRLTGAELAPYLGPAASPPSHAPADYDQLAALLASKVAVPRRARGNPWASAQYIESQKHRRTLDHLLGEAFRGCAAAGALQRRLAALPLPLIVDTWYDGGLRTALSARTDWAELQGISRARAGERRWYRAYGDDGKELPLDEVRARTTLLYKPHGSCVPAGNFLMSDADYVEVLTELDIQTPIPEIVRERRSALGFVFLGCRFHDQLLRSYARQIVKRSPGPRFVLVDAATTPTRNELRFVSELGARVLVYPLAEAISRLCEA